MADNVDVTPGTGKTIAADDVGGVLYQRVKVAIGFDGTATDLAPAQKTKSESFTVNLASDQEKCFRGPMTDRSGTITTGGSHQTLAAENLNRNYLLVVNVSNTTLWVNFGVNATGASPSIPLQAASSDGAADGGVLVFEGTFVPTDSVSIYGATTGKAFVAKEG
jgi:hypothetical protein